MNHVDDEDWYLFATPGNGTPVTVTFSTSASGNVAWEFSLRDSNGNELHTETTLPPGKSFSYTLGADAFYYIRVLAPISNYYSNAQYEVRVEVQ